MSDESQHDLHCASAEAIPPGFDYGSVPELADELRATAKRIREWMSGSLIKIGAELRAVRNRLEHGKFLHWVHTEFGRSQRTAENMMAAKRWAINGPLSTVKTGQSERLTSTARPLDLRPDGQRPQPSKLAMPVRSRSPAPQHHP